jgi:hypothetical protein
VRVAVERNTQRRVLVTFMPQALWAQPALLVRGSSRRITIMRFRPANTRVINRRDASTATFAAFLLSEESSDVKSNYPRRDWPAIPY